MSNGYLVAAGNDLAAAHEISDGFELDVIDVATIDDPNTAASALAAAANVGVLVSTASASDAHYVAILQALAQHLQRAQLIFVDAEARAAFPFLPEAWPAMGLDDARARSAELVRQRDAPPSDEPERAAPMSPAEPALEAPPDEETQAAGAEARESEQAAPREPAPEKHAQEPAQEHETPPIENTPGALDATAASPASEAKERSPSADESASVATETETAAGAQPPEHDLSAPNDASSSFGSTPNTSTAPSAPPQIQQPAPMPAAPPKARGRAETGGAGTNAAASTAPADATAFAPKKLRRGAAELVQVTIHQPKDLKEIIKAAKKANPNAEPAPQGAHIGEVELGASIGVALEARGVSCDGALQRRPWRGEPIAFSFSVEPDDDAKKAVFIARVFIDDAQIGVIGFTRPISGPAKKAASAGDAGRMKRHKRVFLSYSSNDRETVAAIATAYEAAGVPHFWDRASLKSGEEWSPRLRKEIDRADLFHLCWSKSAAASRWVEKETEHALTRRKRSNGKNPDITVQMLDGPPWAAHPRELDAINFDDFVRAAIVGYARGDGSH